MLPNLYSVPDLRRRENQERCTGAGYVATYDRERKCVRGFGGKNPPVKNLGRPGHRRENNRRGGPFPVGTRSARPTLHQRWLYTASRNV